MDIAISTGLDLAIILIFILTIIISVNMGLIKSLISLAGKFISLIVAFIFSSPLGVYIDSNYIRQPMLNWLLGQLSPGTENLQQSLDTLNLDKLFSDLPDFFLKILNYLNVDVAQLTSQYTELKSQQTIESAKLSLANSMVAPISEIISRVIAFAIIFAGCTIIVTVVWWLSDLIIKVPVIKQADKIGGLILGVFNALMLTFVLISIFNVTSFYMFKDKTVEQRENIINRTAVYKILDKVNPINSLFDNWE